MKKTPLPFSTQLENRKKVLGIEGNENYARARPRIIPRNSNARIISASVPGVYKKPVAPVPLRRLQQTPGDVNLGLNSARMRSLMVEKLELQGITDQRVLQAMLQIPRHLFVSQGLASRAYDEDALPIGHGQTISQPYVVARMISLAIQRQKPGRVLEIGTGCGYQAAVLSVIFNRVYSIERIHGLHELARRNLSQLSNLPSIYRHYGDGRKGLPSFAPFDAIIIAAAGLEIPPELLSQLAIGGRLIAPEGGTRQRLVMIERTGVNDWHRENLESVRFVPLREGTQS